MSSSVDLYDTAYAESASRVYQEVRRETYDLDLGQTGWMTAEELDGFGEALEMTAGSRVLEVGCGAGGCAVHLARARGSHVTGIDMNESGIRNAQELAALSGVATRLNFLCLDASKPLPFEDCCFDGVFSNDALCHIPDRPGVLTEWHRLLRPSGQMLFTDAMIITGVLSNEEIATRSCIGTYFLPPSENERLIRKAGFELIEARDTTGSAAEISQKWHDARARRRTDLLRFEGEAGYSGLQRFLQCVHALSEERRLSRYLYRARKNHT